MGRFDWKHLYYRARFELYSQSLLLYWPYITTNFATLVATFLTTHPANFTTNNSTHETFFSTNNSTINTTLSAPYSRPVLATFLNTFLLPHQKTFRSSFITRMANQWPILASIFSSFTISFHSTIGTLFKTFLYSSLPAWLYPKQSTFIHILYATDNISLFYYILLSFLWAIITAIITLFTTIIWILE